jgi:uncharacterized membrane protein YeaQ/YmgE (transglycosylase-associated protein family)
VVLLVVVGERGPRGQRQQHQNGDQDRSAHHTWCRTRRATWHALCFPAEQRRNATMSIIGWIVLGLIAGWLAGQFMHGGGYGIVGDIVLGILGALVGGFLTSALLGRDMVNGFNIESLIVAVIGAIILIAISRLFTGRRVGDRV